MLETGSSKTKNSYEFIFGLVIAGSSEVDNSTGARVVSFGTW